MVFKISGGAIVRLPTSWLWAWCIVSYVCFLQHRWTSNWIADSIYTIFSWSAQRWHSFGTTEKQGSGSAERLWTFSRCQQIQKRYRSVLTQWTAELLKLSNILIASWKQYNPQPKMIPLNVLLWLADNSHWNLRKASLSLNTLIFPCCNQ